MLFIIGVLLIMIAWMLFYIHFVKKQIKGMTKQLVDINQNKTNQKVTVALVNKEIEELARTMNDALDARKECEAGKVKLEKHMRQAIANMSHDLRTPLTSIMGYVQFLKMDNISDDERKEYLHVAEQRAKALESLLNDFYELSLMDSLDYELKLEKINISRMLQEVLAEKYVDFVNRDLQPEIEISSENIYVMAEGRSLERVIENLLGNAVKHAKGDLKISLGAEGNIALLKTTNAVENLNLQDVKNIFDRFYMADKTRSGKGTGLGLSIAKGLVEKMNGSMTAELNDDVLVICCRFQIIKN